MNMPWGTNYEYQPKNNTLFFFHFHNTVLCFTLS